MKNIAIFIGVFFFVSAANAATIEPYREHYRINFSSDIVGSLPTTGISSDTVSSVNLGQPTIEAELGSLNQPLVFNPNIGPYEQIELNLGLGYKNYKLSFDIETNNLVGSPYNFSVLFDTPQVHSLDFHGNVGVNTFNPAPTPLAKGRNIGAFSDNTLMDVDINVNLNEEIWTIDVGSLPVYRGVFYANDNDVNTIRFSLSPWHGSATLDPSVFVGIDNIVVSSIPVPATGWLLGSGLLGLFGVSCFRSIKKRSI